MALFISCGSRATIFPSRCTFHGAGTRFPTTMFVCRTNLKLVLYTYICPLVSHFHRKHTHKFSFDAARTPRERETQWRKVSQTIFWQIEEQERKKSNFYSTVKDINIGYLWKKWMYGKRRYSCLFFLSEPRMTAKVKGRYVFLVRVRF